MTVTPPDDLPQPHGARLPRPRISHLSLNALVASYIMLALNTGFWQRLFTQFHGDWARPLVFGVGIWALTMLLLELFGPGRLQKPVAAIFVLIAAGAAYYERNFGVLIDHDMMRNILETTVTESKHMITPHMVLVFTLTGLLPAALVFWPKVHRLSWAHQLWRWPVGVALCFVLLAGAMFSYYKDYSAMLREHHELMGSYQPGATLTAGYRYAREEWKSADPIAAPLGEDAKPGRRTAQAHKPVLLVLFVGETARAQNFGLNGYARQTTPQLAQRDVINFSQATSCGTSTAVSVPCMFSPLTKANYSRAEMMQHENLMDVLHHAGVQTQWWDNNTGDQSVAKRIGWNRIDQTISPASCTGECTDEAFLPLIQKAIDTIDHDTILVLHMIGSHGPAYYLRYPQSRAPFQPDCRSAQFSDCSTDQIVNSYDNSIAETDHVLAQTIDLLAASDRISPAMLYFSDHGESLGENGLYLHAAPSMMAPAEQTHVPFVLWLSPAFETTMALDHSCLQALGTTPVSHDNLFHSVLGLMDVQTSVRQEALDLTATCHKNEIM